MKLSIITLIVAIMSLPALAVDRDSKKFKNNFKKAPVVNCFQAELERYENNRGRLPNPEEADLIIEACLKHGDS